jgi:hypothetical protein
MSGNGSKGSLTVSYDDLFTTGERAVAVSVGYYKGAAILDEFDKVGIVIFRSCQNNTNPERIAFVRFSGTEILKYLFQFGNDQILGTGERYQHDK